MLRLTLLGTGDTAQVPAFNCSCAACRRARQQPEHIRRPTSALLQTEQGNWLIDAGLGDLARRFEPGFLSGIFLTHYHADHVQGLLPLRWGEGPSLPVYGPKDPKGFADLDHFSGVLDLSDKLAPYEHREMPWFSFTTVPLNHSRPTLGYVFSDHRRSLAYLTDTSGLKDDVMDLLAKARLDAVVIDCSYPPLSERNYNHNDLSMISEIQGRIRPQQTILTHVSHQLDCWLMKNKPQLAAGVTVGYDGMVI